MGATSAMVLTLDADDVLDRSVNPLLARDSPNRNDVRGAIRTSRDAPTE